MSNVIPFLRGDAARRADQQLEEIKALWPTMSEEKKEVALELVRSHEALEAARKRHDAAYQRVLALAKADDD